MSNTPDVNVKIVFQGLYSTDREGIADVEKGCNDLAIPSYGIAGTQIREGFAIGITVAQVDVEKIRSLVENFKTRYPADSDKVSLTLTDVEGS